jgi:hypothetical protein
VVTATKRSYRLDSNPHTNNLLNASKSFQIMKKSKYYWKLNKEYSLMYYLDSDFRRRLNSLLSRPEQQLSLNLRHKSHEVKNESVLDNAHSLDLSHCRDITDVSAQGDVHTLSLIHYLRVTDVNALGNVNSLDLSECDGITDISTLGNVHKLSLSGCTGITDVSELATVHTRFKLLQWHN